MRAKTDKYLLSSILILTIGGFIIFLSASMGLVGRNAGADFQSVILKQTLLGLVPGIILMYVISRINFRIWRRFALPIFFGAIILSLLVFVPGIGLSHGGATRWLAFGSFSFQPSEVLKIAVIIYLAAFYAKARERSGTFKFGVLPFLAVMAITGGLLVTQPDIDTLLVIFASALSIYWIAGAKIKHLIIVAVITLSILTSVVVSFPYFRDRIQTYLNPKDDSLGSGYQITQSLIAIGSGGIFGRGFGQSIQKFSYLPEAIGDSIFAVAGEEFGFLGTAGILAAFLFFISRGFVIAGRANDNFAKYLAIGILTMIATQSFINIGAMLNILPLSGIPLAFVSQGGTALLFTLMEAGILLSISRYSK